MKKKKSGLLSFSQGLGDSTKDSNRQMKALNPNNFQGKGYKEGEIAIVLSQPSGNNQTLVAFGPTSGTSTQAKSTKRTSQKRTSMKETLDWSKQTTFQTQNCSVLDFLASRSLLQEKGRALRKPEERFFMKFAGLPEIKESLFCSLKMLKGCFQRKTDGCSQKFSQSWMGWGITANGRCLTAKISEFPKTGSGCSLSQVLEKDVSGKYFLSDQVAKKILEKTK